MSFFRSTFIPHIFWRLSFEEEICEMRNSNVNPLYQQHKQHIFSYFDNTYMFSPNWNCEKKTKEKNTTKLNFEIRIVTKIQKYKVESGRKWREQMIFCVSPILQYPRLSGPGKMNLSCWITCDRSLQLAIRILELSCSCCSCSCGLRINLNHHPSSLLLTHTLVWVWKMQNMSHLLKWILPPKCRERNNTNISTPDSNSNRYEHIGRETTEKDTLSW